MEYRDQTPEEEIANTLTHGAGLVASLIVTPFLLAKAAATGNQALVVGVLVFAFGMVAVYFSSTLYHAAQSPRLKVRAHVLDHVSIFFLIGGTYAPVILRYTPTDTAVPFLAVQWTIILAGVIFKLFFTGRYDWLSVLVYLFLGWMLVFVREPIAETMPDEVFAWILAGGFAYSLGVVFYRMRRVKYAHAVWHCLVLAGTAFHCTAIYKSLT
jgi:hemolysin III